MSYNETLNEILFIISKYCILQEDDANEIKNKINEIYKLGKHDGYNEYMNNWDENDYNNFD